MTNFIPKININKIKFLTSKSEQFNQVQNFVENWNNDSNEIMLQTSGSTGEPKKIYHQKAHLLASAKVTGEFFNFVEKDKLLLCISANTIGGKMQIIRSLYWNMELIVMDVSRNPIQNLGEKINFCSLTPIQLEAILEENPEKLAFIETILLGGAPISEKLVQKICAAKLKSTIYEGFGMTETISHIALRKIDTNKVAKPLAFKTLDKVTVSEENGNLVICAPHLNILALKTNDSVKIVSPTTFEWLGRTDFVINSGGIKFHPELIEQKISTFISSNFFIFGEKNEIFDEIITLFVEKKYSSELEKELKLVFKEHLDRYEHPKKIYFVPTFEYHQNGKLNKIETQKLQFESKI